MDNEIIFLNPVFTHNIWGGTRLRDQYGYKVEGNNIGECWGIAAHENGDCTIKGGIYDGMRLSVLYNEHPELFGRATGGRFPLLTKFIDAADDLSIQVHPDDEYAMEHENGSPGKRECWYVIDCPDNANLIIGHNARNKDEMKQMVLQGKWNDFLRKVPVKKGSFIQIEPGTVHAITAGCLICETQQNSDITYRLYDYDRLSNGQPRELHIDKSIDVIKVPSKSMTESVTDTTCLKVNSLNLLEASRYFNVFYLSVKDNAQFNREYPFMGMTVVRGDGYINGYKISKGDNLILTSKVGNITINGEVEIIVSSVN